MLFNIWYIRDYLLGFWWVHSLPWFWISGPIQTKKSEGNAVSLSIDYMPDADI